MKKGKSGIGRFFEKLSDKTRELHKTDWVIIGVLVLIYGIISFINLGSTVNPQTFYEFTESDSELSFEIAEGVSEVSTIRLYGGNLVGQYDLYVSQDDEVYDYVTTMEQTMAFSWNDFEVGKNAKYFKIVAKGNSILGELQLYDAYGKKLTSRLLGDEGKELLDEGKTVPATISFLNSAYFDEIYFARSAYEYAHGLDAYEWVHPPLGKLIQAIPVALFGMAPFFYRLMGNLAGILMIPVMYAFGKSLFKDRRYGFLAAILMMFDNFHFAQTRMGTVDSFLVLFMILSAFFMYKYILLEKRDPLKKKFLYLGLSGLFVGCAIATKWTGFYVGLALAIAFFVDLFFKYFYHNHCTKKEIKDLGKIIGYCVFVFVLIPFLIYVLSYLMFPNVVPGNVNSISSIFNQIKNMFDYHSTLDATHPFTSPWYTWPFMTHPVWYYVNYLGSAMRGTIVGIGNPAIWWVGILAAIVSLLTALLKRDRANAYIVLFIVCTWVPYLFIGRIMFLYHYFPTLPFVMLAVVSFIRLINEKFHNNAFLVFYIAVVILFFTYFYPAVSGVPAPNGYLDTLQWLSSWYF